MIIRQSDIESTLHEQPGEAQPVDTYSAAIDVPCPAATWTLQRVRQLKPSSPQQSSFIRRVLSECHPTPTVLIYQSQSTAVRPTAARLLKHIVDTHGEMRPVEAVSVELYGRVTTLRSIRQVVFRVNRAFERVGCPLVVRCQSLQMFIELRRMPHQLSHRPLQKETEAWPRV